MIYIQKIKLYVCFAKLQYTEYKNAHMTLIEFEYVIFYEEVLRLSIVA